MVSQKFQKSPVRKGWLIADIKVCSLGSHRLFGGLFPHNEDENDREIPKLTKDIKQFSRRGSGGVFASLNSETVLISYPNKKNVTVLLLDL